MTASTSTPAASPAKAFACSRSHGDVGAGGGDQLGLLLQPEEDPVRSALTVYVLGRKATPNRALACFVRVAVAGVLRHRAVAPVPFDRGAVKIGEGVAPAAKLRACTNAQGGEADRWC